MCKKDSTFENEFYEFIATRCDHNYDLIKKDPEYIDCMDKYDKLYSEIASLLGDKKHLLEEFSSIEDLISCINEKYAYTTGLKDGLRLSDVLVS
ncbi:MAG: hypothetical protein H0Z28_11705 [Archaeoglobus sp.]|nr:hypothetical protein [Archaeoglobus sp.]